jgi:glycerate-2-kinase
MYVKNYDELVENGSSENERRARRICLGSLEAALVASQPRNLMRRKVKVEANGLVIAGKRVNLAKFKKVVVIGGGKATAAMAETIDRLLDGRVSDGLVNVPQWVTEKRARRILFHTATHPLPSEKGVEGVKEMLELVGRPSEDTLVICLLSGGGSALMPLPREGVSLSDKVKVTELLLKAGAMIRELNVVRKHLSGIKGGWLARKVHPCTSIAIVISDVVGDALDTIASGPLYPDQSTFQDALAVLKKHGLVDGVPTNVMNILRRGDSGKLPETPKEGDDCFKRVHHFVIGSNVDACEAAVGRLESLHRRPLYLTSNLEGEARSVGAIFASIARDVFGDNSRRSFRSLVAGGETTVTVRGSGKGGRNQEAALGASLMLDGMKGTAIAFIGTDGLDGPTEAAGAIADGSTIRRARRKGLEANDYLARNDSYSFFRELGDLVITGPTGTNVNDVWVAANQ